MSNSIPPFLSAWVGKSCCRNNVAAKKSPIDVVVEVMSHRERSLDVCINCCYLEWVELFAPVPVMVEFDLSAISFKSVPMADKICLV